MCRVYTSSLDAFNAAVKREESKGYFFASPPDYTFQGLVKAGLVERLDDPRGSYVFMIRREEGAPEGEVLKVYHRDGHVEYEKRNFAELGL